MHPKFNPTVVRTYDLYMMDSTFHVPKTPVLTTEPPGTFVFYKKKEEKCIGSQS